MAVGLRIDLTQSSEDTSIAHDTRKQQRKRAWLQSKTAAQELLQYPDLPESSFSMRSQGVLWELNCTCSLHLRPPSCPGDVVEVAGSVGDRARARKDTVLASYFWEVLLSR